MKKGLSITDKKIVIGKIQGKSSKQIAKDVYPGSRHGDVTVRKRLQKPTIREALEKELKKQGITLEKVLRPIALALESKTVKKEKVGKTVIENPDGSKTVEYEYIDFEEDNIPLQLQGSDRASKLMGLVGNKEELPTSKLSKEDLEQLASSSDEMELTRILFKKS